MKPFVFWSLLSPIVLRIGSTRTIAVAKDNSVLLDEPALIAMDRAREQPLAIGKSALQFREVSSPQVNVSSIFSRGVMQDSLLARHYFRALFSKLSKRYNLLLPIPLIVLTPIGFSPAVREVMTEMLWKTHFLPLLWINEVTGDSYQVRQGQKQAPLCVMRFGGSQTQLQLSLDGVPLSSASLPIGGMDLDDELLSWVYTHHNLRTQRGAYREIKEEYTKACAKGAPFSRVIRGKDVQTGRARAIHLTGEEMHLLASQFFKRLAMHIRLKLSDDNPVQNCFVSGGLSAFPELAAALQDELGVQVEVIQRSHLSGALGIIDAIRRNIL